jgi:hypothetical protein
MDLSKAPSYKIKEFKESWKETAFIVRTSDAKLSLCVNWCLENLETWEYDIHYLWNKLFFLHEEDAIELQELLDNLRR